MKTILTHNIFEAGYYLTLERAFLREIRVKMPGLFCYTIEGSETELAIMQQEFIGGLAYVHLNTYLLRFKKLYQASVQPGNAPLGGKGGRL